MLPPQPHQTLGPHSARVFRWYLHLQRASLGQPHPKPDLPMVKFSVGVAWGLAHETRRQPPSLLMGRAVPGSPTKCSATFGEAVGQQKCPWVWRWGPEVAPCLSEVSSSRERRRGPLKSCSPISESEEEVWLMLFPAPFV